MNPNYNSIHQPVFDHISGDVENSFYDDAAESFDEADSFGEEADYFLRRSKKKRDKAHARKMERITQRNERKAARKSRGEIKADREQKIALTNQETDRLTAPPPEVTALNDVAANQALVAQYVAQNGMIPQPNPAALALQGYQIYGSSINDQMNRGIPDWEIAEEAATDEGIEQWGMNENGEYPNSDGYPNYEEAEHFFGSVITSVVKAGSEVVRRINEKRVANGKKPLFAGKNYEKLAERYQANKETVDTGLSAAEKAILALSTDPNKVKDPSALQAGLAAYIEDQERQAKKKYIPLLIIALIAVWMIAKNTK